MADNLDKKFLLLDLLNQDTKFPLIVEVATDLRADTTNLLKTSSLLLLLRVGHDEATDKQAVRAAQFDALSIEFPLPLDDAITVYERKYPEIADRLGQILGPPMDVSVLANLACFKHPLFAVCNVEQEKRGERILIHGNEKMQGYLAKGDDCMFVIPDDYSATFKEYSPAGAAPPPTFGSVFDIITKKWFGEVKVKKCEFVYDPNVTMIYPNDILRLLDTSIRVAGNGGVESDTVFFERISSEKVPNGTGVIKVSTKSNAEFEACESSDEVFTPEFLMSLDQIDPEKFPIALTYEQDEKKSPHSYMASLNEDILRKASHLTIIGKCFYTATYISLHTSDPYGIPSLSIEMIPDYYLMDVRIVNPIPVQLQKITSKPEATIHAITLEQFQHLFMTVKSKAKMRKDKVRRERLPTYPIPTSRDDSKPRSKRLRELRHHQSADSPNRFDSDSQPPWSSPLNRTNMSASCSNIPAHSRPVPRPRRAVSSLNTHIQDADYVRMNPVHP